MLAGRVVKGTFEAGITSIAAEDTFQNQDLKAPNPAPKSLSEDTHWEEGRRLFKNSVQVTFLWGGIGGQRGRKVGLDSAGVGARAAGTRPAVSKSS